MREKHFALLTSPLFLLLAILATRLCLGPVEAAKRV